MFLLVEAVRVDETVLLIRRNGSEEISTRIANEKCYESPTI